tara:strand:- start:4109 stop:4612 length:504 start_codon:yes stop_codon:yes gene_type:complete
MRGTKIAFTGPECSGKSTAAEWLAKELSCELVEEYAREYLKGRSTYSIDDLDKIALEQFDRNSAASPLVIDTEMLVMKIWCEEKYQTASDTILQLLKRQKLDIYFLCKPDFNWISDPLRENANDRERLFEIYESNLKKFNLSYCVLAGSESERKKTINDLLSGKNIL